MSSPASVGHHPIHPMIVVFPIALWIFSFVADLIYSFGGSTLWNDIAIRVMAGGVIGAILAAVPGFIDYLSLTGRPKKLATIHMSINLTLVVLFLINIWWRSKGTAIDSGPIYLSVVSIILLGISGWLGGALVYEHATAVECATPEPTRSEV